MRLRLTIAYDGRPFAGWQSQAGGNTVQDHLERSVQRVLKLDAKPVIHGSGRTDAGVHGLAQVAHVDVPDGCRMEMAAWVRALNVHLPAAIRVTSVSPSTPEFHARFDATGKIYRYRIWHAPILPPLEAGLAWHVPHQLDFATLSAACRLCEGEHDFTAFAANRGDGKDEGRDAVRELWSVTVDHPAPLLTLTFHGSGFLYKMVRLLTGSFIRVAMGRAPVSWLEHLLTAPPREKTHYLAPADGLYLAEVEYPEAG